MMGKFVLQKKSFNFALRCINLYKYLQSNSKEFVISKQLLRSGTSIGAQIAEGEYAESKLDFIHKYSIALKECNESIYWMRLLFHAGYIKINEYESLKTDAIELLKMITSSINTAKSNIKKEKTNKLMTDTNDT